MARSEHVTLFVKDCVSKGMERTDHRFLSFASRGRFGWMTMQQAYDLQRAARAPGEEGHSSMLRSARMLAGASTPASAQPETSQGVCVCVCAMDAAGEVRRNFQLLFRTLV